MKRKTWFWALTPVAVALSLYGCGNGSDSDLAVDNNAQSCSVVAGTGSAVVVGSGLPGAPAAPEAASGAAGSPATPEPTTTADPELDTTEQLWALLSTARSLSEPLPQPESTSATATGVSAHSAIFLFLIVNLLLLSVRGHGLTT